jgi:hypothetical protein
MHVYIPESIYSGTIISWSMIACVGGGEYLYSLYVNHIRDTFCVMCFQVEISLIGNRK